MELVSKFLLKHVITNFLCLAMEQATSALLTVNSGHSPLNTQFPYGLGFAHCAVVWNLT